MAKIQITLTPEEEMRLSFNPLGYSPTKYAKFVVSQAALALPTDIPTFKMSKRAEKIAEKARKDYKEGKLKTYNSVSEMMADI